MRSSARPQSKRVCAVASLGLLVVVAAACDLPMDREGGAGAPEQQPLTLSRSWISAGKLPAREQVVAEASRLVKLAANPGFPSGAGAAAASGASDEQLSAALLQRAATLRERLWRRERREADALEAMALWTRIGEEGFAGACAARVRQRLLEAELDADPEGAYLALYRLIHGPPSGPADAPDAGSDSPDERLPEGCQERITRALNTLEAYRPSERLLDPRAPSAPGVVVPELDDAAPAEVGSVEHYGAKENARIVVYLSSPSAFQVGELPVAGHAARLFVDIRGATLRTEAHHSVGGIVERVRLGQHEQGVRVVLDVSAPVLRRVFYLPEPFRLVIDVSAAARRQTRAPARMRRVVLDPGHGGHDPGAVGPSGLREKDVALDIAHRAAPVIASELGLSTLLTRDTDTFIPLDERVARANAFGADLFVSLHCNASEHREGRGVMTFVLDASRDDLAARVAARENFASQQAGAELAAAISKVLDPVTVERSSHFAGLLQRSAMASARDRYPSLIDGGVRRAGFYVLAGAQMPAVLFEASFISNPTEELRLNTQDYRQRMADALVNAIRAYREGY